MKLSTLSLLAAAHANYANHYSRYTMKDPIGPYMPQAKYTPPPTPEWVIEERKRKAQEKRDRKKQKRRSAVQER